MGTETRSHNGCWSCRLRKRKCDEKRPMCTECLRVGLECHGFGERPPWMDRGARQKAQAAKTKQRVAQTIKARRVSQSQNQTRNENEPAPRRPPTPLSATQVIPNSVASLPGDSRILDSDSASESLDPSLQAFEDAALLLQTDVEPFPPYDHQSNFDSGYQSALDDMAYLSTPGIELSDIGPLLTVNGNAAPGTTLLGELNHQHMKFPGFNAQTDTQTAINPSACQTVADRMLPITSVEDAGLLAYYTERTFHWQFRFGCGAESGFDPGYFIWLMSKSRPLYLASLALSSSHRSLCKAPDPPQSVLRYDDHKERYGMAAEELRRNFDTQKSVQDITTLACIVSFISSGLLHSDNDDWNAHLQVGIELITPWIAQQPTEADLNPQKPIEDYSRDLFIGSIMRFHILSAITQEAAPSLVHSYQRLLKSSSPVVLLNRVSGCENWVFSLLLDVYLLREWKRRTRTGGLLSLWDLTSKANSIKHDLEAKITSNLEELEMRKANNEQVHHRFRYDVCVTTHIFACALSVLLEVVVSGGFPQLPEIRQKVERTLESFAYVDDLDLLGVLGWPLFVVGCVAVERQYELIQQLLWPSQKARCSGIYGLLKNCWKSREDGQIKDDTFDFSMSWNQKAQTILIS